MTLAVRVACDSKSHTTEESITTNRWKRAIDVHAIGDKLHETTLSLSKQLIVIDLETAFSSLSMI